MELWSRTSLKKMKVLLTPISKWSGGHETHFGMGLKSAFIFFENFTPVLGDAVLKLGIFFTVWKARFTRLTWLSSFVTVRWLDHCGERAWPSVVCLCPTRWSLVGARETDDTRCSPTPAAVLSRAPVRRVVLLCTARVGPRTQGRAPILPVLLIYLFQLRVRSFEAPPFFLKSFYHNCCLVYLLILVHASSVGLLLFIILVKASQSCLIYSRIPLIRRSVDNRFVDVRMCLFYCVHDCVLSFSMHMTVTVLSMLLVVILCHNKSKCHIYFSLI